METQFAYGKTIRLWKKNSIMEQNSILKKKIDFEIKFPFSTLKISFAYLVNFVASQILNPQLNSVIIFSFLENSDMEKNSPLEKNRPWKNNFDHGSNFNFENKF